VEEGKIVEGNVLIKDLKVGEVLLLFNAAEGARFGKVTAGHRNLTDDCSGKVARRSNSPQIDTNVSKGKDPGRNDLQSKPSPGWGQRTQETACGFASYLNQLGLH
jgi:hypothetical protein